MKSYILNKETQRIELHFTKAEYLELTDEQKHEIKSAFLYSRKAEAWVSRSINNHYNALRVANNLGFTDGGSIGTRLSYAEQVEKQVEKASNKVNRYEIYSGNAEKRAEQLQSSAKQYEGDISFWTQPVINSAAGRSFNNYRERILNRYKSGLDEYRKSEYFKNKAKIAEKTANMDKFKDRVYLENRIMECNKIIKIYEKNIAYCEENNKEDRLNYWIEKMEYEVDKLSYMKNCLDAIGGVKYSNINIKVGYLVKISGHWETVLKLNRTTLESQPVEEHIKMFVGKKRYSEIQDVKIPEGYKEPKNNIINPYKSGDLLVNFDCGGHIVINAYQVLKTTSKGVQLQKVNIINNKPMKDSFIDSRPIRRMVVKNKFDGRLCCYNDDWELYKYIG